VPSAPPPVARAQAPVAATRAPQTQTQTAAAAAPQTQAQARPQPRSVQSTQEIQQRSQQQQLKVDQDRANYFKQQQSMQKNQQQQLQMDRDRANYYKQQYEQQQLKAYQQAAQQQQMQQQQAQMRQMRMQQQQQFQAQQMQSPLQYAAATAPPPPPPPPPQLQQSPQTQTLAQIDAESATQLALETEPQATVQQDYEQQLSEWKKSQAQYQAQMAQLRESTQQQAAAVVNGTAPVSDSVPVMPEEHPQLQTLESSTESPLQVRPVPAPMQRRIDTTQMRQMQQYANAQTQPRPRPQTQSPICIRGQTLSENRTWFQKYGASIFIGVNICLAIACAVLCIVNVHKYRSNPPSTNTTPNLALCYTFGIGGVFFFVFAILLFVKMEAVRRMLKC